jgi:hypothetical protein
VQYQFWNDANANGVVGDAGDVLLRDWTDGSTFIDAPVITTQYGVKARCSTDPNCASGSNATVLNIPVVCPSTGTQRAPFGQTIQVSKVNPLTTPEPDPAVRISWPAAVSVDAIRGSLGALRGAASFTGSILSCLATNSAPTSFLPTTGSENADPGAGNGFYYLVRGQTTAFCNQTGPGYTSGAPKEKPGRDAQLDADPASATCP